MTDDCCPDIAFPGHDKLVSAIDTAIAAGDQHAVTAAVRNALCRLIKDQDVTLPACVHEPIVDHYARRELYRSPVHGYSVVAMTWGPGQGTPLHDHSGLWCVEGVWDGELEIVQYELLEHVGGRYRFRAAGGIHAGPGSAGSLIPPHEYHTIRNASADAIAISLHIYKAEMACCAKFVPERPGADDEWFVREDATLRTDEAA
ncbi:cysteine dioxygenase family protein [Luteimonas sp. 50]|uniref:Cysteine dioxygenase family protein n=1 Tax=Cognatiluteimonas sedimenti TaxID=2927791 RepID=A0ABT0A1W9_9GAMM|nr:cysteine dioxygenase family protein [Lysobacter sedimenti]MCJ0824972.1 cysteine dioxygenase family protein [Lysobacter sedimenti]